MKRRDLLKTAAAFAATPLFSSWAGAINLTEQTNTFQNSGNSSAGIKRFGDGRDWFFENR